MLTPNAANWNAALKANKRLIQDDVQNPTKRDHWLWYVFPSDLAGRADTRKVVLENQFDFNAFTQLDEFPFWVDIIKRLSRKGPGYFTNPLDIGRIEFSSSLLLKYIKNSTRLSGSQKTEYSNYIDQIQRDARQDATVPRAGGGPPRPRRSAPRAGGGPPRATSRFPREARPLPGRIVILPQHAKRTLAVLAGVKEAYMAALEACYVKNQTHLVCCMVSGGIYSDDYVHKALFSTEFGYAAILNEILTQYPALKQVQCVLANFTDERDPIGKLGRMEVPVSARANVSIMNGDSITVACKILEQNPRANVCIMIAGNAGRPFGALGKMDRTGLRDDLNLEATYRTQEEAVLINFLKTAVDLTGMDIAPNALYNYHINGIKEYSDPRTGERVNIQDLQDMMSRATGIPVTRIIPHPLMRRLADYLLGATPESKTRTLVFPGGDYDTRVSDDIRSSPWGMFNTSPRSTDTETVQGFDYSNFAAYQYHFCLLTEDCFVRDPRVGKRFRTPDQGVQKVSFAFVFGPNIRAQRTPEGATSRTMIRSFGEDPEIDQWSFNSLQVV